jgi:hypothetical protein
MEEKRTLEGIKIEFDDESVQKLTQEFRNVLSEIAPKSFIIKKIEELLDIEFEQVKGKDGKYNVMIVDVMEAISNKWFELNESKQKDITDLLIGQTQKHYIGDSKYVLYQYVSNMNTEDVSLRCGSFAYNKIQSMSGFTVIKDDGKMNTGKLNLNGESVQVSLNCGLDKKQIIIGNRIFGNYAGYYNQIELNDVVLYFA